MMLRLVFTALLLFFGGRAYAEERISVKAYPELPAENLIRNSGFELMYMYQFSPTKIFRLTEWSQWPLSVTSPSPWGFLVYPDDSVVQDKDDARFGLACLRLRNGSNGRPRFLVQIVEGRDYTYKVPVDPGLGDLAEQTGGGSEKNWENELFEKEMAPTHVLSFWAKTDGKAPGRAELFNITTAPHRESIVSKMFTNTEWRKIDVPFAVPDNGSALMVVLGLAKNTPSDATVWYDSVSLLPVNTTLKYEVNLPSFKELIIRNKTNDVVLLRSEEKAGSVEAPASGVYTIEALDLNGNTISVEYPDRSVTEADNIIADSGFEEDADTPLHWKIYDAPNPKFGPLPAPERVFVDKSVYKTGEQSLCLRFSSMRIEALVQDIAANLYLPDREYVLSFWAKMDPNASCKMVLDNTKGSYLLYIPVSDCPKWKRFRFVFTTPTRYRFESEDSAKKGADLMVLIMGPRNKVGSANVWLDDVNVHLLLQNEKDAIDLLEGLEKDVTEFYRFTIREQIYDAETAVDMARFDVDDLGKCGIVDNAGQSALREQIEGLVQSWQAASHKVNTFYTHFLNDKEKIMTMGEWDEAQGLADSLKGWRKSWQQLADSVLQPLRIEVAAFEKSIEKERQLLVEFKRKQDQEISDEERKTFAGDYTKALSAIQSADPGKKEDGVLELGRLGNPDATPLLVELLKDDSYPVRRNALYALAWMQASNAVPAIISLLEENKDPWTRRRATQALGMIGDARASPILKRLVDDPDGAVRQNAIISLGWLREPSAVEALTEIVRQYIEEFHADEPVAESPKEPVWVEPDTSQVQEIDLSGDGVAVSKPVVMSSAEDADSTSDWRRDAALNSPHYDAALAVQSLGLIGDPAVKSLLMKLIEKHNAEDIFLLIQRSAIFALGQLGDKAAETLLRERSKDIYLWRGDISRGALNALEILDSASQTRPVGISQPSFMTQKRWFYWLNNHFHRAFGRWFVEKNRPRDFAQVMDYAGATDANQFFEWTVPAPLSEGKRYFESAHKNGLRCLIASFYGGECNKDYVNRMVRYYGEYPAFAGIWNEEGPGGYLDDIRNKEWGLDPEVLERIEKDGIGPDFRWENRELFAQYAEAIEQDVLDGLRESREYMHMLRKGTVLGYYTSVCSTTFTPWPALSLWGRMGHNLDIVGTEPSYSTATYENGMLAEMCRDGGEVCNGMEVYIWRLPLRYTRRWEIGMCISLLHARQFYVWYWGDVFKQLNNVERGRPEAWDITVRTFRKMKKLEPYLVNDCRPKDAALVYSGRTSCILYRDDEKDRLKTYTSGAGENLYTRNTIGLYQALAYEHTQCDVIWADTMTAEKIKDYRVLLLSDAKTLTPDEESILREWVRNGGSLVVTGTTTLFDQYGNARTNYGLADVFGVDFKENTCTIPLENIDSGKGVAEKNAGTFALDGQTVEYDLSYGYDRVEVKTATVLCKWADGNDAAVTLNTYGKGHCLFLTATYPGFMYTPGRIIYRWPLFKHFYEGIPQMLAGLVRQGLQLTDTEPALLVENCPWYVEANLRLQPEKNRMLFQLLNYDEQKSPVHGVKARVRVQGKVTGVYYANVDQAVEFLEEGGYVLFSVRDFDIHEAVVVEYE